MPNCHYPSHSGPNAVQEELARRQGVRDDAGSLGETSSSKSSKREGVVTLVPWKKMTPQIWFMMVYDGLWSFMILITIVDGICKPTSVVFLDDLVWRWWIKSMKCAKEGGGRRCWQAETHHGESGRGPRGDGRRWVTCENGADVIYRISRGTPKWSVF